MFYKLSAAVRRNRKWFVMLAGIIVFVTTYALILPAITIDKDTAIDEPGLEVVLQDSEIADENETTLEDAEATEADAETTDPAETTEPETVEMPPVVLEETSGDVSIKVEAEEGVFPADTTMVLSEVEDKQSLDTIEDAVDDTVKDVQAVEVAFRNADGEPVEPQDSYTLTVEPVSPAEDNQQVVVALDEAGEASVVEPSYDETAQMTVEPNDVPVVALVETEVLTTTLLSASGNTYEATVTFDNTAQIPEGAALKLKEIKQSSKDFRNAKQALLDAGVITEAAADDASADGSESEDRVYLQPLSVGGTFSLPLGGGKNSDVNMDVLDLSIVDRFGREIEPAAPVQVEITMKALPKDVSENDFLSTATVTHLRETGEGIQPEVVASNVVGQPGEVKVENEEAVISFETDSFSQYTVSWTNESNASRTVTVHYGYLNSNGRFRELAASNFSHGTPSITKDGSPNYLIYDMADYEFDYAYRVSASSGSQTRIQPFLRYYENSSGSSISYRYYEEDAGQNESGSGLSDGDQIYMVYKRKTDPVQGGTAEPVETGEKPDAPTILKESTNNHDGTRTLSLSITGHEKPLELKKVADVILIFDVSGSMKNDMAGNSPDDPEDSRIEQGKEAIKFLAGELLPQTAPGGEHLFRMALVTFSNRAQVVQELTYDLNAYNAAVDSLSADGGTNWEEALKIANRMSVESDRDTCVIFVTDGDPTWRMTRYNVSDSQLRSDNDVWTSNQGFYYRYYDVFGKGNSDDKERNYEAALAEAQSIVSQNKTLYTIAISQDVYKMDRLARESGAGEENSYTVKTEGQLAEVIEDIKLKLTGSVGWGNIQMNDGITGLTNLMAKTPIIGVDEDSFTYTKTVNGVESPWNPRDDGANEAVYENDAVQWNMGANFQLEDGVTYKVSFLVWPAQRATDIVTELNNGTLNYEDLEPEIQAQIENAGGFYTVKTNEDDAGVTYYPSRKVNDEVTITGSAQTLKFQDVPPLVVETMPMTLEKVFEDAFGDETGDGIGADRPSEVHLTLECRPMGSDSEDDWEPFPVTYVNPDGDTVTSSDIWLSDANEWKTTFYISPGLRDKDEVHLNEGHEYRLTEENTEYHYELFSEYLNPYLQGHASPVTGMDPLLAAEEVYVTKEYGGDTNGDESLTAKNIVKGGINLFKHVNGAGGNVDPDTEFTIRGWILDPNGNPYLFDQANDEREDKSQKANATTTPLFYAHQNDPLPYHFYNANGDRVIYKGHFSDTSDIEFTIKDGEQIRFPIIPTGCTYQFWEVDGDGMPTGFVLESVEGVARDNLLNPATGKYEFVDSSDLSKYPVVDSQNRIGGTIVGNTLFKLDFYNRYMEPNRITVEKKVFKNDGETVTYPDDTFTIKGYVLDRVGDPFTEENGNALTYNIVGRDGDYVVEGAQFPTSYTFTVTLRGGERLEILDVPALSSYLIWEETDDLNDPDSNFEFVSITGEALGPGTPTQPHHQISFDEECIGGTMHENEEHDVVVKNKMLHDYVGLQIQKVDATNNEKRLNGAKFQLFADEDCEQPATDFNGNPIGDIVTGGFADDETQPLGIGSVGNLLPGTYYLKEIEAPPGYNMPADPVIPVSISETGTVTVLQPDNAAGNTTVTAIDGIATIVVTNSQGVELPHTGGPGTILYTSGGLFLMAAAMIYLICVRRRERRIE